MKISERSKIYIGASSNQFLLGLALVIPAFDTIGKIIPGASLFLPLPSNSKIDGTAGVFTGSSGQNGIGLFVLAPNTVSTNNTVSLAKMSATSRSVETQSKASFVISDENSAKNSSLKRSLYFMSLKSQVLSIK